MIQLPSKEVKTSITCLPKFLQDTLPTERKDTTKVEAEAIGTKVENQITEAKNLKTNQIPKTRNKIPE